MINSGRVGIEAGSRILRLDQMEDIEEYPAKVPNPLIPLPKLLVDIVPRQKLAADRVHPVQALRQPAIDIQRHR